MIHAMVAVLPNAASQIPPDKRRISVLASILITFSLVVVTAAGMGWLSLHQQANTIKMVTALYNQAFEGVNNAHWAYGKFERLIILQQGTQDEKAAKEQADLAASIKEHLGIARDFAFSERELAMIAQIEEGLDSYNTAPAAETAAFIDRDMQKLVRSFMVDRMNSREQAIEVIENSRRIVIGCLGLTIIFVIVSGVILVIALLPQLKYAVEIAETIAAGKLDNKIAPQGIRETALLLKALSSMQESLSLSISSLEAARERAIKSENVKSEFLANMSHELRTPLNNIIGSIQLLQDGAVREKDRELFGLVEKSSLSLLGIVNDILDLSKIEAGEVHLEHIGFDVFEKVRDVAKIFMAQAAKKGIAISGETQGEHLYVLGDPLRFERILTNLAGNALRYTEQGSIRLVATWEDGGNGKGRLRCEVIDTGIGIPLDRQEKIFERFTQSDNSTSRKYGGTGLGLTITKELVGMMQGKIGVMSEVGKGSTFWIEMPFEKTDKPEDRVMSASAQKLVAHAGAIPVDEARVLIAEDHELNRAFMRRLFAHLGISSYVFAENGVEAVEEVRNRNFDVVLMDCHMPEMDGYTATGAIRALPDGRGREIPIVAMTANAMESEKDRCIKAGMNAYIGKPFDFDDFRKVLSPWINFTQEREQQARQDDAGTCDLSALVAMSKGDDRYVEEMIAIFIATAEEHLVKLKSLSREDNAQPAWTDEAHGLKGAAAIVGANRLRQLAAQAQNMEDGRGARIEIADAMSTEYGKLKNFLLNKMQKEGKSFSA